MPDTVVPLATRHRLGCFPTAFQAAPALSEEIGSEVWFKRDDLTGLGLGGNKVRALEYLVGRALHEGCDVLVTGAGPQSNWAMLAALAARRAGLDAVLCFYGDPPAHPEGNLRLILTWTTAEVRWTGDADRSSVDTAVERVGQQLGARGRRPYVLPRGGATPTGCLGYVTGALELAEQASAAGLIAPTVWTPTGSCGTQAGLIVGAASSGLGPVVGVTVSRSQAECVGRVTQLAGATADLAGLPRPEKHSVTVIDGWKGSGYGKASPAGVAAADLVARTEGVFLDPVFGAKAMAALVDRCRIDPPAAPVVFLVTGGAPALLSEAARW